MTRTCARVMRARLRARGVAVVMAVAIGHAARVARNARRASRIRVRARHRRASRASSPVPFPPLARARALRRRRSLDRSIARTRCGGSGGGGGRLHRAPRASHMSRASLVTRAHAHMSSPLSARHHRFPFPRARPARARAAAAAALARSLDRSIARTRCGVGDGGSCRLHRVSCVSRARAHVITAHRACHHRSLPRSANHARVRRSLARSSARPVVIPRFPVSR